MIRVGVFGAAGRMGAEVCRAVTADPDLQLVCAVDPASENLEPVASRSQAPARVSSDREELRRSLVEVAVDFTHRAASIENISWCIDAGIHVVVGTTGFSPKDLSAIEAEIKARGSASGVFIAPNFAIGAVLMMRFASMASRWFEQAEIIELHHPAKLDSPSGTAIATAEEIARGSQSKSSQGGEQQPARGLESQGVHIHSVRLPGLVAHQEVIFGSEGQTLTLRHDSIDRKSFIPGVLLAIKQVGAHKGLTIGLERLLKM